MRVALDVTAAAAGTTGVARYATQLTSALRAAGVDVAPFVAGRAVPGATVPDGARRVSVPRRVLELAWRAARRPRADGLVGGADVVHALDLDPPPAACPVVVTVHDLAAVARPDLHAPRAVALQRRQLAAARRAAAVIAVSHATASALERAGVPRSRIAVTHLAATPLPLPVRPAGLTGHGGVPFVLAVGGRHPRKRLDVLLAALAGVEGLALVHAGPDAGAGAGLAAHAAALGVDARVTWLGPVGDGELAWLYGHALATCLPSDDEGFGLPVVEAQAAGCPVIASDVPALREVGGDTVRYVPRGDAAALADALRAVPVRGPARDEVAARSRAHASTFTWEATARATIAVYEQVVR